MPPKGLALLEKLHRDKRIAASGLRPVEVGAIAPALRLLQGAKCAIARMQGPWLEESKALAAATLILADDLSLHRVGALAEPRPAPSGPASPAEFRRVLGVKASSTASPDYWDSGTAMRIASHLIDWLPRPVAAGANRPAETKGARAESELAVI